MNTRATTDRPSTVLGRQLGDELRRHREASGLTTAQAAEALDCTKGKISRMENGRVVVRTPDVAALLLAYGVNDPETRERLTRLTRTANRRRREGWWHQYSGVLADTYKDYIEMESICREIRTFQAQLIPGLLQTPEYSRAVTVASRAWQSSTEIDQFVQVRVARQQRLTGETSLSFWAVLAEGVLHQRVGGPDVMQTQLNHVIAMAERPNVTVQILPFSRGAHSGMFGPYLLMSFPQETAQELVLTEMPTGNLWMEQEPQVTYYRSLFDDARTVALPPTESLALIRRTAEEFVA
ncbi:helix-turn-helix domain-containing protein [Streptomyces sp. YIM S03343]